jgi:hypothetical protein
MRQSIERPYFARPEISPSLKKAILAIESVRLSIPRREIEGRFSRAELMRIGDRDCVADAL